MSHGPHASHKGYTPDQVLHDGCAECDSRAKSDSHGISHMDVTTFGRAWERAATWQTQGLDDVAHNEVPVFRVLVAIMTQLQHRGIPWGELPARFCEADHFHTPLCTPWSFLPEGGDNS